MSEWVDLTVEVGKNYLVFPGDPKLQEELIKSNANDGFNLKQYSLNMHIGTHVDFKNHVLHLKSKEVVDFNDFFGKGNKICPKINDNVVSTSDIIAQYEALRYQEKILFLDLKHSKKFNSTEYFNYPVFEPDFFKFLVNYNIKILGADIPSFNYKDEKALRMHKDLLGRGLYPIENLTNLDKISEHFYFLGLPLKINDLDASMIRAIAKSI